MRSEVTLDELELRRVLGRFVTGVTVVTADVVGVPLGLTANSFTSVSMKPPLVLFCVHSSSRAKAGLQQAGGFAINILGADQEHISRQFARAGENRFADVPFRPGRTGAPILVGAVAYLECRTKAEFEGGDHLIVLGEVLEFGILRDTEPLAFLGGRYGQVRCPAPDDES
ncbi:flavin reductase [Micromonospora arborensis]|uniref:Flavin reductase n=1 Tax=Micromonospora arborensis TaxID=2116518 RepID=A0A318NL01_9ACTN|nr:flavin reductase family protein [Micromonospora arborensis]PYC71647.1 flavin reductase [Micromonospora arborensis]